MTQRSANGRPFGRTASALAFALALAACGGADTAPLSSDAASGASVDAPASGFDRDSLRIVGSSTVYPFATTVAEAFGQSTGHPSPIVESTGSGGGLKLFCEGVGADTPDIANASRRIKESEVALCARNGVENIVEMKIGYDGIVFANARSAEPLDLNLRELYLALARDVPDGSGGFEPNPNTLWSDVDPRLPERPIEVLGPPPTSGTRDAFVELAMEGGCETFPEVAALKSADEETFKARCHTLREDDAFTEAGEQDNLVISKLGANPNAFGIFGYGFLDQNRDSVQAVTIDGVEPSFENIAANGYPIARSLYVYIKGEHAGQVPGLQEFAAEFLSPRAAGEDGYLADKGLIPMPEAERADFADTVAAMRPMDM